MQTRTFGLRGLALAVAGVLTLGLTACDDTDVVPTVNAPQISISPSGTVELAPGESFQVVASTSNFSGTVAYSSSNTNVATVSAAGVVTAVNPGIASIVATASNSAGTSQAAVTVRVTARTTPPQTDSSRVAIIGVVDNNNNPVPANNVQGQANVRVDYTRGAATRLQVLVNNTVACEQTFGSAPSVAAVGEGVSASVATAEFVCPIITNRIDPATGQPTFPNGVVTITARLLAANGSVLAQANAAQQYTFNNQSTIQVNVTPAVSAIGANGLQWNGGSVTVTGTPAIFTSGTTIARMSVTAYDDRTDTAIGTREDLDASNGLSVTFPNSGSGVTLAGVSTDSLRFVITAVTSAGAQFTFPGNMSSMMTSAIRYDAVAPAAPTFTANLNAPRFLNNTFTFSGGSGASATTDVPTDPGAPVTGSNAVTVDFVYLTNTSANAGLTNAAAFAAGTAVTNASAIPTSITNTAYFAVARARDAVGNVSYTRSTTFGVDLTAPTFGFTSASAANMSTNPSAEFEFSLTDDISGPAGIWVKLVRYLPGGTTCVIGTGTACNPVFQTGTTVTIPTDAGYYEATVYATDQAGNRTDAVSRMVLVDTTAPGATVSAFGVASNVVTISGTVTDNVDLRAYDARAVFAGGGGNVSFPFAPWTVVGEYGLPADGSEPASGTVTQWNGIEVYPASDGAATTTATSTEIDFIGATFGAFDVAGNSATGSVVTVADGGNATFTNLNQFRLAVSPTTICRAAKTGCPGSATLTARAYGPSGTFVNPFSAVNFYWEDANGQWRLLGTATSASSTDTGVSTDASGRVWTYSTVSLVAAELMAGITSTDVIAIGVSGRNLAATAAQTVTIDP